MINNDIVRALFEAYYVKNMKPNLSLIAEKIGISYFYLVKWRKGKVNMADESLLKIIDYIHEKQTA